MFIRMMFLFVLVLSGCKSNAPTTQTNRPNATPYYTPPYNGYTTPYNGYNTPYGYNTSVPGMRVTYMANIAPIIQQRCVTCHNPSSGKPVKGIYLQTYNPAYNAQIVSSVLSNRMPPQGNPPLTYDLQQQFTQWQQAQFPYQ